MRTTLWLSHKFRRAKRASAPWNLAKTFAHIVLMWGVFLFALPWLIAALERAAGVPALPAPEPAWWPWLGFALASALGLWSGITMAVIGQGTPLPLDAPNRLVVRGPYRFVRNPMAMAGLAQAAFIALHLGSATTLLYTLAGGLLWNYVARPPEELHLEREFGQAYLDYRDAVRCWVPRLRSYPPR